MPRPVDWLQIVNQPQSEGELEFADLTQTRVGYSFGAVEHSLQHLAPSKNKGHEKGTSLTLTNLTPDNQ